MGWSKALEALFKIVAPIIAFFTITRKAKKAGINQAKLDAAEGIIDARREQDKDGENWDSAGGLGGLANDRLQNTNNSKHS